MTADQAERVGLHVMNVSGRDRLGAEEEQNAQPPHPNHAGQGNGLLIAHCHSKRGHFSLSKVSI